jgi:hypothetical protein
VTGLTSEFVRNVEGNPIPINNGGNDGSGEEITKREVCNHPTTWSSEARKQVAAVVSDEWVNNVPLKM